jgi:hydroxylamine reductase (hybrid-cluster protein)
MSKRPIYDMVKEILSSKPEARDNDMYLCAIVWYRQSASKYNINALSLTDFFHLMRNYKSNGLLSFETISRQRRLVQEACPELRGEEYEQRHKKQAEVKQDLKEIKSTAFFGDDSKPNEELLNGQMPLFGQGHG